MFASSPTAYKNCPAKSDPFLLSSQCGQLVSMLLNDQVVQHHLLFGPFHYCLLHTLLCVCVCVCVCVCSSVFKLQCMQSSVIFSSLPSSVPSSPSPLDIVIALYYDSFSCLFFQRERERRGGGPEGLQVGRDC